MIKKITKKTITTLCMCSVMSGCFGNLTMPSEGSFMVAKANTVASQLHIASSAKQNNKSVATSGNSYDNISWSYNEKTKTLTLKETNTQYPAKISYSSFGSDEDYPWKPFETKIENIHILGNVSMVEANVFDNCKNTKHIILAGSVKGCYYNFENMKKLESIYLGDKVSTFTVPAKNNLKKITISKKNKHFKVVNKDLLSKDGATLYYSGIGDPTVFHIPASVEKIDIELITNTYKSFRVDKKNKYFTTKDGALYSKNFKTLYRCLPSKSGAFTVPDTTKTTAWYSREEGRTDDDRYFEENAIGYCSDETETDGLSGNTFFNCTKITELHIGKKFYMPEYNYVSLTGVTKYTVDPKNPYYTLKDHALLSKDKTRLITYPKTTEKTIRVPSTVTWYNQYAIDNNDVVEHIILSDEMSKFSFSDLANCPNLTTLTFGLNFKTLDDHTEYNDTNIKCPSKLKKFQLCDDNQYFSVKDGVLYNKKQTELVAIPFGLKSYTMPSTVTSCKEYALWPLDEIPSTLRELTINDNFEKWDELPRFPKNLKSLTLGKNMIEIKGNKLKSTTKLIIPKNSKYFIEDKGCIYSKDFTKLYYISPTVSSLTLPAQLTSCSAQINDVSLDTLYTGDVISNYPYELLWIDVTTLVIGKNVQSIKALADNIVLSDENKYLTLKNGILYSADGTRLIQAQRNLTGKVTILDTTKVIEKYAFNNCKLSEIVLPDTLESIEEEAFFHCTKLKNLPLQK